MREPDRGRPPLVYYVLWLALMASFFVLTLGSILVGRPSLTYDEPQHFRYGRQILQGSSDRFDDGNMPVSALNVVASDALTRLAGSLLENEWQSMSAGRIATLAFSFGVALLCAAWASQLGGRWAGLLAFGLYALEPNLAAHSILITTDVYSAGTITVALYLFWKFLDRPSLPQSLLVGTALGLALAAKYTGLLLLILFPLLAIARYWRSIARWFQTKAGRDPLRAAVRMLAFGMAILLMGILVVNAAFLFNQTGKSFGEYSLRSPQLRALQSASPLVRSVPVPLPYPYLDGLDRGMYNESLGVNYGKIYLLGRLRQGEGFPGYFLVASLFKVPLGLLALFVWGVWDWARAVRRRSSEWPRTYLFLSMLFFSLYFNFIFERQIGLRFLLVAFPAGLVFTAQLARSWQEMSRGARVVMVTLLTWILVSVLSYFPDYIPYFNELVPNRRLAYRILSDSNLIWGQSNADVEAFMAEHPDYLFEPGDPEPGMIVVGVNRLTGVLEDPDQFRWLRENFTPVGDIRHTHLIFEVTPEDLEALGLSDPGG